MRNEIKLSFDEPKYHIDLANKVVVCVLHCQPLIPQEIEWTAFNFIGSHFPAKYVAKGVARLNPDDTFDEKIGMKVALAKAESKAYLMFGKDVNNYVTNAMKSFVACQDFLYRASRFINHNEEYLNKF